MRADFYGRFASVPASCAELLEANRVFVGPMRASELRRAVELPAVQSGLRVEPGLADALLDEVEGEPAALPFAVHRPARALPEPARRAPSPWLPIARRAASTARSPGWPSARTPGSRRRAQATVRAVMLRLVGDGEGEAPVRRRAALAELDLERDDHVADGARNAGLEPPPDRVGQDSVEVTPRGAAARVATTARVDRRGRRRAPHPPAPHPGVDRVGRGRAETRASSIAAPALLRPSTGRPSTVSSSNELEREFVSASREASERETRRVRSTNRRLRALLAGVAALLVAALAGGVFAGAFNAARRARARPQAQTVDASASAPQALAEDDLDLSLLLARQAVAIDDTPQTTRLPVRQRSACAPAQSGIMHGQRDVTAFRADRPQPRRGDARRSPAPAGCCSSTPGRSSRSASLFEAPVVADFDDRGFPDVEYSPDGGRLAFSGPGYVLLIDARTREQLAEASFLGDAARIAFTRDGARLAVLESGILGRASITIRDALTLQAIGSPIEPDGFAGAYVGPLWETPDFALAGDGTSLVTVSPQQGELAWWDLESHEKTRTLRIERGSRAMALSPDDRTIAISRERGIRVVDVRTGAERGATGRPDREPHIARVQSGRQDDRVVGPRRGGDHLGYRLGGAARDAERPLRRCAAARPSAPTGRRSTRRAWTGRRSRGISRAIAGWGGGSPSRTTGSSTRCSTGTRARSARTAG